MKRGPIFTLLVVVVLAAGLLALDLARSAKNADQAAPSASAAGATSALPAPAPPAAAETAAPAPATPGNAPGRTPAAGSPFPTEAKYTGRTEDGSAAIAVTVRNNQVSAYLCDGHAVEGWYSGSAANGSIDAKGKGGNTLSGSLSGASLTGAVSANGRTWTYSAAPVSAPAGLYRAKSGSRTAGWIKDSSGRVTGLANDGGAVIPAPPLDPSSAQYISGGDVIVGH